MTSHSYPTATPITDPEVVAAWVRYEAESAAAKAQYAWLPISHWRSLNAAERRALQSRYQREPK